MLKLTFYMLGTKQVDFGLSHLMRSIDDFRPVWPDIVQELEAIETEQFEAEGQGRTGKWPKLSSFTQEWKARYFPGTKILERTRKLRQSLTETGAEGAIRDISRPDKMAFGTSIPYAGFHQRGTGSSGFGVIGDFLSGRGSRGKLPMRRVIDLKPSNQLALAKIVQKFINKDALKGFRR